MCQNLHTWGVFEEVKNREQRTINTRWVVTEKIKEGKAACKARLVARGFEEYNKQLETEAPTCSPETLKLCIAKILQEWWIEKSIDVKTAYLQGSGIEEEVYLKPSGEANTDKVWRLKKTVYGLKVESGVILILRSSCGELRRG